MKKSSFTPPQRGRGRPPLRRSATGESLRKARVSPATSSEKKKTEGNTPTFKGRGARQDSASSERRSSSSVDRKKRTASSPASVDPSNIILAPKRRKTSTEAVSSTDAKKSLSGNRVSSREQRDTSVARITKASKSSPQDQKSKAARESKPTKAPPKSQNSVANKTRMKYGLMNKAGKPKFGKIEQNVAKNVRGKLTPEMRRLSTTSGFWSTKTSSRSSSPAAPSEQGDQSQKTKRGSKPSTPEVSPSSTRRKSLTSSKKQTEKEGAASKSNIPVSELRRLQTTDGFWSPTFVHPAPRTDSRDVSPSSVSSQERGSRSVARSQSQGSDNKSQTRKMVDDHEVIPADDENVVMFKVKTNVLEDGGVMQQPRDKAGKFKKIGRPPKTMAPASEQSQSQEDSSMLTEEEDEEGLESKPKRRHFYFGAKKRRGKKGPNFGVANAAKLKAYGLKGSKYGVADKRKKKKVLPKRNSRFLSNLKENRAKRGMSQDAKRGMLQDTAQGKDSNTDSNFVASGVLKSEKKKSGGPVEEVAEKRSEVKKAEASKQRRSKVMSEEKVSEQSASTSSNKPGAQPLTPSSTESSAVRRKAKATRLLARAKLNSKSPVKLKPTRSSSAEVNAEGSETTSPVKRKKGRPRGVKRKFW